jgi:cytochrome c oxidase subunit 3
MTTTTPSRLALRFQFATVEQQRTVAEVGMWVFLATEIMMFSALFTAYAIYRMWYGHAFAAGSNFADLPLGAINTAVLLTSSFTMAMSVLSSHQENSRLTVLLIVATMVLGAVFLALKFYEYHHHWLDAKVPGFNFRYEGPEANHVEMFFMFYFIMTGLHAVHMIVGEGLLAVLAWRVHRGVVGPAYNTPVEITGLYWHFVDIVWVFLFPLFYLVGRHLR